VPAAAAVAAAHGLLLHLSTLPALADLLLLLLLLQAAAVAWVLQLLLQLARLHAHPLEVAPREQALLPLLLSLLLLLLHCGPANHHSIRCV
jgi:hypothetical protein